MADLPDISSPTREAIFAGYERDASEGFRTHLGASLIGKACERALWYDFRWTTKAKFPGRVLRLFETGNREEERLVRNLRRTGATVVEVDPQLAEIATYAFVDDMRQQDICTLVGLSAPTLRKRLREFIALCRDELSTHVPGITFAEAPI